MQEKENENRARLSKKAWQAELSSKSIKKREKYRILDFLISDCRGKYCMEIGAETGVITDYLKKNKGGRWIAGTLSKKWYDICLQFTKGDVTQINPGAIDFKSSTFEIVLASRPEHIRDDDKFFGEVYRILKPQGELFILTPHIHRGLFLNRLKEKIGLTLERYDHHRPGYNGKALQDKLERIGFEIIKKESYCRLFSEFIELMINASYAYFSQKKAKVQGGEGPIDFSYRPGSQEDISQNKLSFKLYSLIFPLFLAISKLDYLLFSTQGYVLYLQARKVGKY